MLISQRKTVHETILFCDGGCIGRNPSTIGGTWAWCLISPQDELLEQSSGIITPEKAKMPKITNNLTELLAAVEALSSVVSQWDGTIYTDSKVTYHRLHGSSAFTGIPLWLRQKTENLRRGRRWKVQLLGGHPSAE